MSWLLRDYRINQNQSLRCVQELQFGKLHIRLNPNLNICSKLHFFVTLLRGLENKKQDGMTLTHTFFHKCHNFSITKILPLSNTSSLPIQNIVPEEQTSRKKHACIYAFKKKRKKQTTTPPPSKITLNKKRQAHHTPPPPSPPPPSPSPIKLPIPTFQAGWRGGAGPQHPLHPGLEAPLIHRPIGYI